MSLFSFTDDERAKISTIMERSQIDKIFRKRMLEHPEEVLKEIGLSIPSSISIITYDVPRGSVGLVLPSPLFDE